MKITRRRTISLLGATAASLSAPYVRAEGGRRLVIRHPDDFTNFDPANYARHDEIITRNILAPLVRLKSLAKGGWAVEPQLATAWEQQSSTDIQFDLRTQSWSGTSTTITARDVAYSFKRIAGLTDPPLDASRKVNWSKLQEVEAVDDTTVLLSMSAPVTDLMTGVLARGPGCIVSRDHVEAMDGKTFTIRPGHSSGRYKTSDLVEGSHLDLDADPNWSGQQPEVMAARFKVIYSEQEAIERYRGGEIDHMEATPDVLKERADIYKVLAAETSDAVLTEVPLARVSYVAFNTNNGPLADPSLRRAALLAIDPRIVIEEGYGKDGAREATGVVPDFVLGALPERIVSFDPDEARNLVRDAFYFDDVVRIGALEPEIDMALAISTQLQDVGIRTEVIVEPVGVFFENFRNNGHDLAIRRVSAQSLDGTSSLSALTTDNGSFFSLGFANEAYDALVQEAGVTFDFAVRVELMQRAQAILWDDSALLPIAQERKLTLSRGVSPAFYPDGSIGDLGDWRLLK